MTYGRVYMLEFDPADQGPITSALVDVTERWQKHKDVDFTSGVSTTSQGQCQFKIWLKADSFMTFEHCDAAIRDAAILHMRKATLSPVTTWFNELQENMQQPGGPSAS